MDFFSGSEFLKKMHLSLKTAIIFLELAIYGRSHLEKKSSVLIEIMVFRLQEDNSQLCLREQIKTNEFLAGWRPPPLTATHRVARVASPCGPFLLYRTSATGVVTTEERQIHLKLMDAMV